MSHADWLIVLAVLVAVGVIAAIRLRRVVQGNRRHAATRASVAELAEKFKREGVLGERRTSEFTNDSRNSRKAPDA